MSISFWTFDCPSNHTGSSQNKSIRLARCSAVLLQCVHRIFPDPSFSLSLSLSLFCSLSFALSLSLSHTHTHIRTLQKLMCHMRHVSALLFRLCSFLAISCWSFSSDSILSFARTTCTYATGIMLRRTVTPSRLKGIAPQHWVKHAQTCTTLSQVKRKKSINQSGKAAARKMTPWCAVKRITYGIYIT